MQCGRVGSRHLFKENPRNTWWFGDFSFAYTVTPPSSVVDGRLEFKLDGTAEEALQQIQERGYATAFAADSRPLFRIGASFSSKTGTVEDWKMQD